MKKAYLKNGKMVNVVSTITNDETGDVKYLISDFIYTYDGYGEYYEEPSEERMYFAYEIFDSPPVEILDERVSNLNKEIKDLNSEKSGIEKAIKELKKVEEDFRKRTEKISVLKNVFDFIDEKITHYVINSYGNIKILKFEDTEAEYARNNEKRLLVLFGQSNGDLAWKLSKYADGSGSNEEVIPCTSYDMAVEEAQKIVDHYYKTSLGSQYTPDRNVIMSAKRLGLNISEDYIEKYKKEWEESHKKNITKIKSELKVAENKRIDI